jgi:colanic acid biosynthesis protein WcaH
MSNKKAIKLNHSDLIEVVKKAPLVSLDIIVRNSRNQVLLGLRTNEPAKDSWFVPGGRILKNESIAEAFERIGNDELGISLKYKDADFLGVFEHSYEENFAQKEGFGTHYIVLAYQINTAEAQPKAPDDQHSRLEWFDEESLLKNKNVHPHTKAYFK